GSYSLFPMPIMPRCVHDRENRNQIIPRAVANPIWKPGWQEPAHFAPVPSPAAAPRTNQRRFRCRSVPHPGFGAVNSPSESGLKPCCRLRPWNGFLRVPFHVFQTLFKQSFLGVSQRIVLIKPLIGIEFSELETNLLPLFLGKLGQFLQDLCFAHRWNLTGQLG